MVFSFTTALVIFFHPYCYKPVDSFCFVTSHRVCTRHCCVAHLCSKSSFSFSL